MERHVIATTELVTNVKTVISVKGVKCLALKTARITLVFSRLVNVRAASQVSMETRARRHALYTALVMNVTRRLGHAVEDVSPDGLGIGVSARDNVQILDAMKMADAWSARWDGLAMIVP